MTDPSYSTLAHNLITFSCRIQPGEKVLIEGIGEVQELVRALVREAYAAGGVPFVWLNRPDVTRELTLGATEGQLNLRAQIDGRADGANASLYRRAGRGK